MTLRTTPCGLVCLILGLVCGLPAASALAQERPARPAGGVRPGQPPPQKSERPPETQEALERLLKLRDEMQKEQEEREASGEVDGKSKAAQPPARVPPTKTRQPVSGRPTAPDRSGATGEVEDAPQQPSSLEEMRNRARASTQRAMPPARGAHQPLSVPADFVGPPEALANTPLPESTTDEVAEPEFAAEEEARPEIERQPRRKPGPDEATEWFNFAGVPWEDVIAHFVERVGKPLLETDVQIGGELTYISDRKFTQQDAIDELNLIMHEKGYRFVEDVHHIRILPVNEIKQYVPLKFTFNSVEAFEQANPRDMDFVVVYYQVQDKPAKLYVDAFVDALPEPTLISALPESNQIKIVALARDVRRFLALKDRIDLSPQDVRKMKIFNIKTNAADIEQRVRAFLQIGGGGAAPQVQLVRDPRTGRMMPQQVSPGGSDDTGVLMVADERTNSIIVKATSDKVEEIGDLITRLDEKPDIGEFKTKVIEIEHADAVEVASLLNQILQQEQGQAQARMPQWQLQRQIQLQMQQQQRQQAARRGQPVPPQQAMTPIQAGVSPEDIFVEGAFERAKKTIRMVADARTNSLIVYANEEGFNRVEEMLKIIDKPLPDNFRTFVLEHAQVADLAPLLTQIVGGLAPAAAGTRGTPTLVPDEAKNALHVMAERDMMQKMEDLIQQFDVPGPEHERHIVELQNLRPSAVAQMVQTLLASTGGTPAPSTPRMPRGRSLGPMMPSGSPTRTADYQLIPLDEAQILIVICSAADWDKIEQTIQMWDERALTGTPKLEMFPITEGSANVIANTLSNLYRQYEHPVLGRSGVTIQPDGDKLWVYAVQPALEEIGELVKTLDVASATDKVEILPVVNADAAQLQQQVQALFSGRGGPRGGGMSGPLVQAEPLTNSLIVQADRADMEKIKDFVLQMDQQIGAQATEQRFFELRYARAQEVANTVQTIFGQGGGRGPAGRAQVRAMAAGAQVIIEAPKEKFATIEAFIKQLDDPKGKEMKVESIKLPGCDVAQIAQMLNQTMNSIPRPDGLRGAFIPDPATESIIASAPADMYVKINELVSEYRTGTEELALERRFYPITIADASYVADLLSKQLPWQVAQRKGQTLASRINISVDPRQNQVIVNAPRLVHPDAQELIDALDREDTTEIEPVTIELRHAEPNQVAQTINTLYGGGRGAAGQSRLQEVQALVSNGLLIVRAPKARLEDVRKLIDELDSVDKTALQIKTYTLKVLNAVQVAVQVQQYLRSISPTQRTGQLQPGAYGEPATNTLVVIAPADHLPFVDQLVAQFENAERPESTAKTYTLTNTRAEQVAQNIDMMLKAKVAEREGDVRKARVQTAVLPDVGGNRLFVFAPDEYHRLAAELIRMVDEEVETGEIVHIIPLENGDAAQVAQSLGQLIAGKGGAARGGATAVRVTADAGSNSVLLAGLPKDVAEVEQWIQELEGSSTRIPEMQIFQLHYTTTRKVEDTLKGIFGGARTPQDTVTISADEYSGQLIVTANKRKMRQVETFIKELDRAPEEGESDIGYGVYFVDIYRGKASDIEWDLRSLVPPKDKGGPSIESDWFDQYLIVKCRPAEFPKIEKLIRELEGRVKVETVQRLYKPKGDTEGMIAYLLARSEGENVVIEAASERQQAPAIREMVWPEGEEPDIVRIKREKAEREKDEPNRPDDANRPVRRIQQFQTGLPLAKVLLDELEEELTGSPAPAARPAGPQAERTARLATSPGYPPAVRLASLEEEPQARAPMQPPPALPSTRGVAPPAADTPAAAQRDKTRIIRQPDGTFVIQGPRDDVDDITKVLDMFAEDTAAGEVIRIFQFKYGDVSAAAEILSMMFDVQQRQIVIPQPQPQPRGQQRPGDEGRDQPGGLMDQLRGMVGTRQTDRSRTGPTPLRIATDPGHNYLIIKCQETLLPEIRQLLRELDIPPGEVQIKIFQLKNLSADETAENIKDILGISKVQQRRGGATPQRARAGGPQQQQQQQLLEMLQQQLFSVPGVEGGAKVERVEIVPNGVTNSLLVSAPPEVMSLIERVIGELEELEGRDVIGIYYCRLDRARVDDVLPLLQEIFSSAAGSGGGAPRLRGPGGITIGAGGGASPAALGPVTVSADPRTNTIIYTAQAKDVDTVEKHIRALDLEGPLAEAEMYVCQWGDAEAIVSVLEPIFTPGATPGGLRGGRVGGTTGGTSADVRIVAEAATNAILVWGARDQRDLIFEKIEALDRLAQRGIREIPVVHADPERLADILNGAFGGGAAQPGGRRTRGPGATGGAGAAGSGRVTIIGDKAARKLLVRAPDETFRQIQDLAATLDVPSQDMKLRRFQLKFADAEGVVEMVRQALNDYLQLAKTTGAATDFDAFTAVPDTRTNSITVVGSDRTFLFVEQVLAAVDLATPPDQRKEFRIFLLEKADAVTVADAINGYASGSAGAAGAARSGGRRAGGGPTPAGATGGARDLNVFAFADEATNAVMVYGRPEDIDLVEDAVIAQLEDRISDRYQIATLPVQNVPPSQIVSFISMFMGEQATPGGQPGRGRTQAGQAGPQIVPNDNAKTLVVRGTKRQVDEVRDLVERFDDQDIVQQTIKVIEIPYGQDASRLATEVERVVNGSEEEIASRTGRQPRRVVVGADQYTNTLIVAGDPTLFGQAEAIVQQLSEVRSDNYVTRVIELKKLSAQDAEDVINTLQQKTGGSGGRGTSGAGIRRPSGSGSSSPSIRPTSPTPTGGGQRQSGSTPARPPRTPSGGGSAPRRPGGAGASLYDQEERGDEFVLFQPATWVEPIITATPLSPVLGAFLMSDPPDDPPPGEQEAPKARPRRQAPARQPAAQRPGSRPEILRQLEEELADEEPTTQPEAEPLSPIAEGLTGVSGALRGEVAARAVDSQRIVITGDASDVEFIEQILLMMEQTAAPALVEVFTLQKAKATALAPIIEKAIKAQIDARTTKPGPQDKFSINAEARSNSLVVAAAAPLLERIGELVEKLDIVREGMDTDIRMMALEHIRAAEAVALLRPTIEKLNKMREVPTESQASIEADERSNSVLIIGTPSDLEEIQKLLTAVDVELTAEQKQAGFVTADAVVIQLRNGTAEEIAKVLNDMIKAEQEAATQGGGTDRRAGKPFVKKIRLRLADGEELPELNLERPIRLVPEKGTNSLIIFSSKENNEALAAIVDLFDTLPVGVETDVKAFALQHASAEVIAKLIEDTFQDKSYLARPSEGDAKSLQKGVMPPVPPGLAAKGLPYPLAVHHDARSNTVLVIGRKDAVLLAGGLISELDRPSVDLALKSYVIPLKAAQAAPLQDKLKKLLDDRAKALGADKNAARDNAIVYADERSNKLIVLATQDVYDMVEDLVLQLDAAEKYSVVDVRYRALVHADAVKLKNLIEETFKSRADAEKKADKDSTDTLSVLADTRSNSLLLTGTRDYLEEAERLISQLDRQYDGTVLFRARKVRLNSAPNVASLLQEMIDKALAQKDSKLSGSPIHVLADPVSDSLLLAGAREDLEVIDRWVEILDRPSEVGRMTRIIPLQRAVAEDVSKAVSDVFKRQGGAQKGGEIDINVAADKATNSIVVFGPPALLADVESFVKELDATEPTRGTIVRIFPLEQAAADDAGELLNRILELRGGAVGGTGGGGSGSSQQEAAKQVMLIFQRQHPELGLETLKAKRADIVVIADVRTNSLVVTAPPESMPLMESLVAAVDVPPQHAKIRVFRLRNADAAEMVKMLEALFEQKTTTTGGRAGAGGEPERVLTVGEGLGGVGGRQMIAFTTDIRTNSVIAAGTPGYLDLAESMVLELDTLPIEPRDTWVYAPRNITAESLEPSIKSFSEAEQKRLQDIGDEVSIGVKQERQVTVIANKDANRLILDVDPRFKDTVMSVVRELDQPPPQVLIQVLIVEVTMDNSLELGVEFAFQDLQYAKAGVGDTTTFDFVGGTDIGAAGSGLGGFTFTITGADFNFLFRTLQSEGNLNVLSRPQIVAMDNQLASIKISDSVPYVTGTSTTTGGQITTTVDRQDVGIQLEVTPQINPDGFVRMEIKQVVSDVTGSTVDVGPGVTAPVFFEREANTTITVKDNETVVLGGLITSRRENREQKVPLIGDIPGLGLLFRNQQDTSRRTELLVVLTPHVIRTVEDYRELSIRERDRLVVTPIEVLSDPLMEGLQLSTDEAQDMEARRNKDTLPLREAPAPLDNAVPSEEYGPLRPVLRPEPPPAPPDSYDVPLSLRTR